LASPLALACKTASWWLPGWNYPQLGVLPPVQRLSCSVLIISIWARNPKRIQTTRKCRDDDLVSFPPLPVMPRVVGLCFLRPSRRHTVNRGVVRRYSLLLPESSSRGSPPLWLGETLRWLTTQPPGSTHQRLFAGLRRRGTGADRRPLQLLRHVSGGRSDSPRSSDLFSWSDYVVIISLLLSWKVVLGSAPILRFLESVKFASQVSWASLCPRTHRLLDNPQRNAGWRWFSECPDRFSSVASHRDLFREVEGFNISSFSWRLVK